jgi:murein endopeptidase
VDEANAIFPARDAARKWEMRGVVQHTEGHRDHLHIRLRCGSVHKSARDTAEP